MSLSVLRNGCFAACGMMSGGESRGHVKTSSHTTTPKFWFYLQHNLTLFINRCVCFEFIPGQQYETLRCCIIVRVDHVY